MPTSGDGVGSQRLNGLSRGAASPVEGRCGCAREMTRVGRASVCMSSTLRDEIAYVTGAELAIVLA